ncbi:MAG: alanyl-tRNA editing protein AlaXM [Nitrososphaeria archaeon]|nr:alanyl-tRNA editing protein AlaXM [Nitrososphaeria archaeon]
MLTELLYQKDSYLKEFKAKILEIKDNSILLDRTAFHPLSGGLDSDKGMIIYDGSNYNVVQAYFESEDNVWHVLDVKPEFGVGENVKGVIDWERRYKLMKLHTASHILSSIMFNRYGALVTGGHIDVFHAKDDFSLESSEKSIFEEVVNETNNVIRKCLDVKIYFLDREEALNIPGIVKLAQRMPPNVKFLRIVEIPGVDVQADGGPHVKNTGEIGEIVLEKVENKGRGRKRIYYKLKE